MMRHVPLPLAWGSENAHFFNERSSTLMLWPENIWSFEGDVVGGMQIMAVFEHAHPSMSRMPCLLAHTRTRTHPLALLFLLFWCAHAMLPEK